MNNRTNPLDLAKIRRLYDSVEDKGAFVRETKINLPTLTNMLNGKTIPTVPLIATFAAWFDLPCGALFKDYDKYQRENGYSFNRRKYSNALVLKDAVLLYNE
jgi:hypothetical protein